MKAKDRHKQTLIEYMGEPDNVFPGRGKWAEILNISKQAIYKQFTLDEMSDIEAEGLALRRGKLARHLAVVDSGLLSRAADGDPQACKLVYQRFEGWREGKDVGIQSGDGSVNVDVQFVESSKSGE